MSFFKLKKIWVLFCCMLLCVLAIGVWRTEKTLCIEEESHTQISVSAYSYNYYQEDDNGCLVQDAQGEFVPNPGYIRRDVVITPAKTAIVIMDPWSRTSSKKWDAATKNNIEINILPLMKHFTQMNFSSIYIFTNNPKYTPTDIDERLLEYVDDKTVKVKYHQDYPSTHSFVEELKRNDIENVLYLGYATNICLLYRDVGILPVHFTDKELKLYVIPEATLAFVDDDDSHNQMTKEAMCLMLAQNNIAKLIHANDLLTYSKEK